MDPPVPSLLKKTNFEDIRNRISNDTIMIQSKILDDNIDDNILLLEDFIITLENKNLQHFTDSFNLENLIHETTCFKGLPSCIDLISTNWKPYFKNTCVTATGGSDFHKLTGDSWKFQALKAPAKRKFYRNYKNFDEDNFNKELKLKLDSLEELDCSLFENMLIDVLNIYAPIKTEIFYA